MPTYSAKELKWDEVMNSKVQHMPNIISLESEPPVKPDAEGRYPVAIPGFAAKDYAQLGLQAVEIV
jgi:hypothetical protein